MDTTAVAKKLGIENPKTLRQYLRSETSSFTPVGTGKKYDFQEGDLDLLEQEFNTWRAGKKPLTKKTKTPADRSLTTADVIPEAMPEEAPEEAPESTLSDAEVWAEEAHERAVSGLPPLDVVMQRYLSDPAIRAEVARKDREANEKLIARLAECGLTAKRKGA